MAASLVIVGGTAGMAAAASGALPGDPLYPIKRGIEQVATGARLSDASQGEALLNQAATRLEEVRELQAQGDADPDVVASTLDSFRDAANEGSAKLFTSYQANGDTQDIEKVRAFTAQQMGDIAAMSARQEPRDRRAAQAAPPTSCPTSTSRRASSAEPVLRGQRSSHRPRSAPAPAPPRSTTCSPGRSRRPRPTSTRPRRRASPT